MREVSIRKRSPSFIYEKMEGEMQIAQPVPQEQNVQSPMRMAAETATFLEL